VNLDNYTDKQLDNLWSKLCEKRYGVPNPVHLSLQYDKCDMILWNQDELPSDVVDNATIDNVQPLIDEYLSAENKHTVIAPVQWEQGFNILVDDGLNEMAKRDTAESTTTNLFYLFGSNGTAEVAGDSALNTQVLAKSFASAGSRGVITASKTGKYLMPVSSSDYTGAVREAGLATGNNPPTDVLITRYTFPLVTIAAPQLLTAITTIVYKNGTVT